MFNNINHRRLGVGFVVSLIVVLLAAIIGVSNDPPVGAANDVCKDVEGSTTLFNQQTSDLAFGPAVPTEATQAKAELHKRRCLDPALTTADAIDAGFENFPFPSSDDEWDAQWRGLNGDRELWLKTIEKLESQEATASAEVVDHPHSYHTMWFLDGPPTAYGAMPYLRQGTGHAAEAGLVLKFTFPDGSVRMYRLSCGFQPVRDTPFPKIPPPEVPPSTTVPSTTVPGTTVPGTTVPGTTVPGTTVPSTTTPCEPPKVLKGGKCELPPASPTIPPTTVGSGVTPTSLGPSPTATPDPTPTGPITTVDPPVSTVPSNVGGGPTGVTIPPTIAPLPTVPPATIQPGRPPSG